MAPAWWLLVLACGGPEADNARETRAAQGDQTVGAQSPAALPGRDDAARSEDDVAPLDRSMQQSWVAIQRDMAQIDARVGPAGGAAVPSELRVDWAETKKRAADIEVRMARKGVAATDGLEKELVKLQQDVASIAERLAAAEVAVP